MRLLAPSLLAAALACVQPSTSWQDPAAHRVQFVTVDGDVRLEVLDWGGTGQPLVLLSGSGNTAHVFDDFAPKLRDCCHVYAITRRGYGASTRPAGGYDDQRLADDVLRVIEKMPIERPVLVGHSMSGGEMTTLGRQHSDRVAGLVYLDALGDLEDDPPADKEWAALQQQLPPGLQPTPTCAPIDRSSFADYRRTFGCRMGFLFPESELRQTFEDAAGRVGPVRTPDDLLSASKYQPKNADERAAIDRFMARSRIVFGRWTTKLTRHVPSARIVRYPLAGHYVFLTRKTEVLREIHAFVSALANAR